MEMTAWRGDRTPSDDYRRVRGIWGQRFDSIQEGPESKPD